MPLTRMPTVIIDKGDFCTGFSDDDGGGGCSGNGEDGDEKHNNVRSLKTPTALCLSVPRMPRLKAGGATFYSRLDPNRRGAIRFWGGGKSSYSPVNNHKRKSGQKFDVEG